MADALHEQTSCYQIRSLRLVNFHNFVDETIQLQGSLFLIGNNGTGKTTIIDAIHLVMTGGQQLTYNAATVFGPRSEAGRTLSGVILRHDFETGNIGRPGGAIGYAAMELVHTRTNHTLTLGIGAFVESLDQRPELWGFVVEEPLDEVPLTTRVSTNGSQSEQRPVDRRELIELLGRPHVYDIGRYRTQVANRLFGGRENFERIADLLKASKSYKELVVKARDFEGLFAFLLPAPDHQVFQDIETTLQSLDKIEGDLKALCQERDLLEEALNVVGRIGTAREAIERYAYLQLRMRHETVDREATKIQRAIHRNEEAIADATARLETVVPQLEQTRTTLAEVRVGEPGRLHEQVERLELEIVRCEEERAARQAELDAEATKEQTLQRDRRRARDDFREVLQDQLRCMDQLRWPALPRDIRATDADAALAELKTVYRAITQDSELDTGELRAHRTALMKEVDALETAITAAQQPLITRRSELERARAELDRTTVGAGPSVEFLPDVPGYAECAAELDNKGIEWSPLYRLVDWHDDTPDEAMELIEAYLGETYLGTVFVAPEQLDTVVQIVTRRYPGVLVADTRTLLDEDGVAAAADSISSLFVAEGRADVRRFLDRTLGHIRVAESGAAVDTEAWIALDGVAYGERAYRGVAGSARGLLGAARRQQAVEAHMNALRARRSELESQLQDVVSRIDVLTNATEEMGAIRVALSERLSPWLVAHRLQQFQTATAQLDEVKARVARIRSAGVRIDKQQQQLNEQVEAMRRNRDAESTGDIAQQVETLRKQVASLERERDRCRELIARHNERLTVCRQQAQEDDARRAELEGELDAQRQRLRAVMPAARRDSIDAYVDELCGTHARRPNQIDALIKEQERAINREIGSLVGLEDEQHRGRGGLLHHELLWSKYAFAYDEQANELRDQDERNAEGLLDALVQQVSQLQATVSERRRKLLEKTILGDLSNQYTRDLYRLRESLNAVNRMLEGLAFGRAQYRFTQKIKSEYRQVYGIVRRAGSIDPESQHQLKNFFESRLEQLRLQPDGTLPRFLDYRHWFNYQLHVRTTDTEEGIELTSDIRRLGSGGEQAVPNYLLIMAMGALLYNQIGARVRVLLFDEAFYGIDAARREELLRFASRLGIDLVVATPEMDGVTEAMRESTTLLLEKTDKNDVFIGAFAWASREGTQMDIFAAPGEGAEDDFTVKTEG